MTFEDLINNILAVNVKKMYGFPQIYKKNQGFVYHKMIS